MAVDLIQLAAALRLGDGVTAPTEPVAGLLARLLLVSQEFVARAAPRCSGGHSRRSGNPIDRDALRFTHGGQWRQIRGVMEE